jgi:hypothetical protein
MNPGKGKNLQDFAFTLRAHIPNKIVRRARTVLGSLPETVFSLLGLEHLISHLIASSFAPWCERCSSAARIRPQRTIPTFPDEGLVALVVASRGDSEITLSEWCELLGAERARCGEALVLVSDLSSEESGEPVLKVCRVDDKSAVTDEVGRWFASGGSELVVYYFAAKGAPLKEIARLNPLARCESCGDEFAIPTLAELAALPDCSRCKGAGWIDRSDGRSEGCPECDGYGSSANLVRGICGSVALRYVGCLSFRELAALLNSGGMHVSADDACALNAINNSPFADYALGTPIDSLSSKERQQLTCLSAEISGLSGIFGGGDGGGIVALGSTAKEEVGNTTVESTEKRDNSPSQEPSSNEIRLTHCDRGPLAVDSISFSVASSTAVRSRGERAAFLLLEEVAQRFKKRRKLAASCSFGNLRECVFIDGEAHTQHRTVLELLGLADQVACEVSRTQAAQRAGLTEDDFVIGSSTRRCGICVEGLAGEYAGEVCASCNGSGLSAQVCTVPFGAQSYGDLVSQPLSKLREILWMNDVVSEVVAAVPPELASQITPVTRVADLDAETAHVLRLSGALKGLLVEGHRGAVKRPHLNDTLLLLWKPFLLTTTHHGVVLGLFQEVVAAGATVVAAGVPGTLENCFDSVIELRQRSRSALEAAREPYFDSRYVRIVLTA